MKFQCNNKECKNFGKVDDLFTTTWVTKDGRSFCKESICRICGEERENVTVEIPLSEKNISIGKIAGMSKAEQVGILKKRSHAHFEKNIKERKDGLMNQAISEMKNKI